MAAERRVEIGFDGGQVVALKVESGELEKLRKALDAGSAAWHDLASEDGTVSVALGKVVFVKLAPGEHRIGFGGTD